VAGPDHARLRQSELESVRTVCVVRDGRHVQRPSLTSAGAATAKCRLLCPYSSGIQAGIRPGMEGLSCQREHLFDAARAQNRAVFAPSLVWAKPVESS
jgi:hypothetical protein